MKCHLEYVERSTTEILVEFWRQILLCDAMKHPSNILELFQDSEWFLNNKVGDISHKYLY